jgi:hypothetical protein
MFETKLISCMKDFHSQPTFPTPNDIVSYNNVTLFQILAPLLPSNSPYNLTLSLEELLIPKIKNGGKIPRPLNSWLLFLKDYTAMIKLQPENNKKHRIQDISTMASKSWSNQPPPVKQFFEILSVSAKKAHGLLFPNYKFRPERRYRLRFEKIKNNTAPRIDLPSQLPLEGGTCVQSSLEEQRQSPSPSYDFPSSEEIYYSLLQDNNEVTNEIISMKEFFELTVSELNNTKHIN